jgi:acetylornithine deacetylase/succinyl-diaminopimelate desuccinylase-like protein
LPRKDPDLGAQTLTVTHLRSFPDSTHTIQDACEMTIDRRLLPGDDPDVVFTEIEQAAMAVDGMPDPVSGKPFKVEVRKGPFMYPSRVQPDAPVVGLLSAACEKVLGHPPVFHFANSAFDQGYLNHIGIPTVNWGPGEYGFAHTDQDLASVERVRSAALVYANMLLDYLT